MQKILYITLAFILCFTCVMPVSYADTVYPSVNADSGVVTGNYDIDEYFVYQQHSNGNYYVMTVHDINNAIENNSAFFKCVINPDNDYPTVVLTDGIENYDFGYYMFQYKTSYTDGLWHSMGAIAVTKTIGIIQPSNAEYLEASIDITYNDGTTFFPPPPTELHQVVQGVTDQEMTTFPTTVVGAMKILVLCGVGCLALLMVFPLFGKVLKRYLPR